MRIGSVEIGAGHPCRFVSELGNAWRTADTPPVPTTADRDRLGRLIDAAKDAGADFIKLQCYTPEELVALRGNGPAPDPWGSQGWSMRDLYTHAQTPFDWFPKIKTHCERVGMPWFSSVFGKDSLALLESLDCQAYKIAALDNHHDTLLTAVRATGKPMVVSKRTPDRWPQAALELYCPPGYPQLDLQLRYVKQFDGLSYHGTDPSVGVVAVAGGAHLIEAHLMLCDEPSELEANVSLDEYQFAAMVQAVKRTEVLLGDS